MPKITYKTFLMREISPKVYQKVIDIKDYPDLGGTREAKDITTLSHPAYVYIPGLKSGDNLEFTANYDFGEFAGLKMLEVTEHKFAVWMGGLESGSTVTPTGSEGKFEFTGTINTFPTGAGVDDVSEMKITIVLSSEVVETGFAVLVVTQDGDIAAEKASFSIGGYPEGLPSYWTAKISPVVGLDTTVIGGAFEDLLSKNTFDDYVQGEKLSVTAGDYCSVIYIDTEDIIRAVGTTIIKNTI